MITGNMKERLSYDQMSSWFPYERRYAYCRVWPPVKRVVRLKKSCSNCPKSISFLLDWHSLLNFVCVIRSIPSLLICLSLVLWSFAQIAVISYESPLAMRMQSYTVMSAELGTKVGSQGVLSILYSCPWWDSDFCTKTRYLKRPSPNPKTQRFPRHWEPNYRQSKLCQQRTDWMRLSLRKNAPSVTGKRCSTLRYNCAVPTKEVLCSTDVLAVTSMQSLFQAYHAFWFNANIPTGRLQTINWGWRSIQKFGKLSIFFGKRAV